LPRRPTRGRTPINPEIAGLVPLMTVANPLWDAPRTHGELLKLRFHVAERTVSRLIPKRRTPPSQTWRTFLTAPSYLLRDRDSIYGHAFRQHVKGMGIGEVLTAPLSPWQNPFAERLIGSRSGAPTASHGTWKAASRARAIRCG